MKITKQNKNKNLNFVQYSEVTFLDCVVLQKRFNLFFWRISFKILIAPWFTDYDYDIDSDLLIVFEAAFIDAS